MMKVWNVPLTKLADASVAEIVNEFDAHLNQRLTELRDAGLYRELRRVDSPQSPHIEIHGRALLNFSSNDYLGLANDPLLKEAAIKAIERFGAGAGASRLICGSLAPLHELEEALAEFKRTESALTFSTGYATAAGTIGALLGKDDIIILDKLVHACIVDAARLCGAKLRIFAHNDLNDLEDKLKWAAEARGSKLIGRSQRTSKILVVTESVFSMDGDLAPLKEIVALKEKYGAWLMLDEAHAVGILGKHGRGLAEELGVSERIEIQMGTLGKAVGASGGYICGSRSLIDLLINRARSFIFSTAPVPASVAASAAALRVIQSAEGDSRRRTLRERIAELQNKLGNIARPIPSAIIPIIIGDENEAVEAAYTMRAQDIFVPAIRFPTVARGAARLRVTMTAAHQPEDISKLSEALQLVSLGSCPV